LSTVIPAKAGIQLQAFVTAGKWIPAFAGMTTSKRLVSAPGLFSILAILCLALTARADSEPQPRTALAMQGEPRFPNGFPHLDYVDPNAPKGGTLIQARIGSFDSTNRWIITGTYNADLTLTYDQLMQRTQNEPYTLYGLVAQTATVPEDRSWIEFALDPRAKFSDGAPITAEDVIFTYETLRRWGRPFYRNSYANVAEARRIDDRHVRFILGPGYQRETVMSLAQMPALSKAYWQGREFNRPSLDIPVTSGPYRIAAIDPGRSITFQRRDDYWAKDLPVNIGLYNFDTIRDDYYRDDNVALEAFKAGAFNFRVETDATKWMTGYVFPAMKDGRALREDIPEARVDWMRGLIFNLRRPLFADRRVRQALGLAFDFEWMNRALFRGAFRRIESYFPNSEFAASGTPSAGELALLEPFRAELPPEVFGPAFQAPKTDGAGDEGLRPNLRHAMSLLEQSGWLIRDGRLVDGKSGAPFKFEILLHDPHDERMALPFARALKRLGIQAVVRTIDEPQYIQRRSQFDFDMILDQWVQNPSPVTEPAIYWNSRGADARGSRNYPGIKSAAVDALTGAISNARDHRQLIDTVRALDRVMSWGYYAIPLYYLGVDHVAYWRPLCHPAIIPGWGLVVEAWYADSGCAAPPFPAK
jgi:microcin C transport system substrate-binding protein